MKPLHLICLICGALSAPPLHAQSGGPFSLNWSTIAAGGGTSTGGVFAVSGTIGQPDAGSMSGGTFTLAGGFWAVIQTPEAPYLSITNSGGTLTVFWERQATGFVLDETLTLTGAPPPWMQVDFPYQTNATHIYKTAPAPSGNKFYRLRKP